MNRLLIFILLVGLSTKLISQTPINVIHQYKSLSEWETSNDSMKIIFDNYLTDNDSILEKNLGRIRFPHASEIYPQILLVQFIAKNGKLEYNFVNKSNPFFESQISSFFDSISINFTPNSNFKMNMSFSFVHDSYECEETLFRFKQYVHDGYKMKCDFDCYKYSEERVSDVLEDLIKMREYDGALYYSKILCRWKPFNLEYNKRHLLIEQNIREAMEK